MKALKRWIRNWLGVTADGAYPHRFVALINFRDKLIGIDGNGDFYEIVVPYEKDIPFVQLMSQNPLER